MCVTPSFGSITYFKAAISFFCLFLAWSLYKIKMRTSIVHTMKPANCSVSLEEVTRNWVWRTCEYLNGIWQTTCQICIYQNNLSLLSCLISWKAFSLTTFQSKTSLCRPQGNAKHSSQQIVIIQILCISKIAILGLKN